MPDLLQDTIDFDLGGDRYIFGVPTYKDEMLIGMRERNLRMEIEREIGNGFVSGSPTGDNQTDFLFRVIATFQTVLKSGPRWLFGPNEQGEPVIDYGVWPKEKANVPGQVLLRYELEVRRFREGWAAAQDTDGGKAMAGQPNPGGEPVQRSITEPQ